MSLKNVIAALLPAHAFAWRELYSIRTSSRFMQSCISAMGSKFSICLVYHTKVLRLQGIKGLEFHRALWYNIDSS